MEAFPFLDPINSLPGIRAGWVERIPGLAITGGRDEAMRQLRPFHETSLNEFAPDARIIRAEQVHGSQVVVVPGVEEITAPDGLPVVPDVDGLLTSEAGIVLVIYVADCGVIWLADCRTGALGLLHSGKKGTESDILTRALERMREEFGSRPEDIKAVLGPCIRPPDYEIDFAAQIARQAKRAGIPNLIDCGTNTASDLAHFYSYRTEQGKTGRMMATIVRDITTP